MTCPTCAQIRALFDLPPVPATPQTHILDEFIKLRCTTGPGLVVTMKGFYQEFQGWALLNGHRPGGISKIGTLLSQRGYGPTRGTGGVRMRYGITLR